MHLGLGLRIGGDISPLQRAIQSVGFYAPLTASAVLARGTGSPTFVRATTKRITDHEGVLRTIKAGEIGFDGARRVENLLTFTEDFSNAAWVRLFSINGVDTLAEDNSTNIHYTYQTASLVAATYVVSLKVKIKAGTRYFVLRPYGIGSGVAYATFNLVNGTVYATGGSLAPTATISASDADGFYRVSMKASYTSAPLGFALVISKDGTEDPSYTGDGVSGFYLKEAQLENVTGQSIQTAGEYVSVGVESAPSYHGAMVDGVKYFPTTLAGVAIPAATLKGYSAEPLAQNLCLQSQTFDVGWTPSGTFAYGAGSVVDATAAPDGTLTADLMVENSAAASRHDNFSVSFTATAAPYTFSCYVKPAGRTWVKLRLALNGVFDGAFFDLTNGVVGTVDAGYTAAIEPAANGFYRVSVTATLTAAGYFAGVRLATGDTVDIYDGNGSSGVYVWGAQVELGSVATSYIPTTTVAVQRNADVLSYQTASNFSDTAGTMYAEVTHANWTVANGMAIGSATNGMKFISTNNGVSAFDGTNTVSGAAGSPTGTVKMATGWSGSTMSVTASNTTVGTGSYDGGWNLTTIGIGAAGRANIKEVRIWPTQLSDALLKGITA